MNVILSFAIICIISINFALAKTDVFFQNNTNFDLSFEATKFYNNRLSDSAFKQHENIILANERKTILSFNRDSGVKKNKTYDLVTEFSLLNSNSLQKISLAQRLIGLSISSKMWQGVTLTNLSQSREWQRQLFKIDEHYLQLSFRAISTLTDDDIEYVLDDITAHMEQVDGSELKVLAYNLYMRPSGMFHNGQSIRANLLYPKLNGYDVLILSELFDDGIRKQLLKKLKRYYPYQSDVVRDGTILTQDGGVVVLSKWPIVKEGQLLFRDNCFRQFDDCLSDKGAKYVRIVKGDKYYSIIGTHTQSLADRRSQKTRATQFAMIKSFIDNKLSELGQLQASEAVIVGGDLNVHRYDLEDYTKMIESLNVIPPQYSGLMFTYDPISNQLASEAQEYLDYIFPIDQYATPTINNNHAFKLQSDVFWRQYFWEPYFKDLSDHYPVFGYFKF